MNIIHLISGGDVGGAKTHVLSLVAGLCKTENIRLVCFTEGDFAQEARQLGIPTVIMADRNLLRVRKQLLALLAACDCHVLHCHGARANLMGRLLRSAAGIPVISTVHSDYRLDYMGRPLAALTYGNINRLVLPQFDAWVGVSHGMTRLLTERGFDPERIYTLYNGVDFSAERTPRPRAEYLESIGLTLAEDSVVFGIAARISPVKDMTTLIRAFSRAVATHPSLRLAIAGDGEQETEIRALADRLCPSGSVCFAGWVTDIDSFYNALDVNLLTSLSETFPYALTEGARMHCATIASEVGGVPYLIDDGVNGFLFPAQDVDALAKKMICLAENAALRTQMGDALFEKTRREFSLDAMVAKQKSIYQTILRRAARAARKRDGVIVCGAYGKGNCGDNAILNAIVSQLRRVDPDLPICALSRNPTETRLSAGVNAIYTFNIFRIGRLMRRTKLYISGGGTLMQDATSTRSLLYYLFSIRQAAKNGCRIMLYGCGIGPISRPRNRKRAAKTLDRYAEIISVRDSYSEQTLDELGVSKPAIFHTADPALLIDVPDDMQRYLRRCGLSETSRYMMISVRPWVGFSAKAAAFAAAAEYAHKRYGLIPVLYAMEPSRDVAACRSVSEALHCEHLLLSAGIDGRESIALVQRMELVLSMRLHTLIFASGQGVAPIGVVYDPKVRAFLDDLGQQTYLPLEEVTAERLCACIDRALLPSSDMGSQAARLCALAKENEQLARRLLD